MHLHNETGLDSSFQSQGCQMAIPLGMVYVSTCAHLDINNMDIIYHTRSSGWEPMVFVMSHGSAKTEVYRRS